MTTLLPPPTFRPPILGIRHMVSSGHYLASLAGVRILEQGGNAIDAGVAAGLCLNVLQPEECNFGGVAPILVYLAATGEVRAISGLGRWPRAASARFFHERHGGRIPPGILRSVTPAAPDAWITALARFGTLRLAEVAAPAIELADGFPMYQQLHANLAGARASFEPWPSSRAVFLRDDEVVPVGESFRQPDLAATLRALVAAERAASGGREAGLQAARDLFYRGEIARELARFCREQGGLLAEEDLAEFAVAVEAPLSVEYHGRRVYTNDYWCQGPVLLQTLGLLEGVDLPALGHNSAAYIHTVVNALQLVFADRERYQGDPEFVRVPRRGLLSPAYAEERRALLRQPTAFPGLPPAGDPWRYEGEEPPPAATPAPPTPRPGAPALDTSFVCAVDRWGNAFVATPSDMGAESPIVPGLGFIISNRGSQSWTDPGHPSVLAPGKRPRLTPMPALATRDGRLDLVFGTPGGDVQPQAMLQLLLNLLDFGMELQEAIEAPRFASFGFPNSFEPHGYEPNLVKVEERIGGSAMGELLRRGHRVEAWPAWTPWAGVLCAIRVGEGRQVPSSAGGPVEPCGLAGAADPRKMAYAIGR